MKNLIWFLSRRITGSRCYSQIESSRFGSYWGIVLWTVPGTPEFCLDSQWFYYPFISPRKSVRSTHRKDYYPWIDFNHPSWWYIGTEVHRPSVVLSKPMKNKEALASTETSCCECLRLAPAKVWRKDEEDCSRNQARIQQGKEENQAIMVAKISWIKA